MELSPCKILFLGLGKYPLQITQMHIEEYRLRNELTQCKELFLETYQANLLNTPEDGLTLQRVMVKRKSGRPNKKNRRLIYRGLKHYKHKKVGSVDIVLVDAEDAKISIDNLLKNNKLFSK